MADTATHAQAAGGVQPMTSTLSKKRIVLVMAGTMLGMLLAALDQTIVGTALPRIIADFNGLEHYAWVVTAYMLASTVMVPIYGKLSDIYGRRLFFLGGMIVFLAGSALAGMSQNMTQLILFRGLQGLGGGALIPIALVIIGDIFPPSERGKWQGLMTAMFGLSSIVGPSLGGWLTDNWGWRWVFYVNMPVGILALVTAGIALPRITKRRAHSIDYLGSVLLVAGAIPLLLAFSWAGTQYAWGSVQIIGLIIVAVVVLIAFLLVETKAKEPIITPSLFKNSIFSVSVLSMFLVSVGMFGTIIYLPLFIQGVLGHSATNSGAVLTPMMLGFMVSSFIGGMLMSKTGRYKVLSLSGFAVATVGMFLLSRMTVDATDTLVIRNMVITGLGIGVMMSLFTIIVQNAFPFSRLGEVTSSLQFFRSIGGTIGVALFGSVMTNRFSQAFDANLPQTLREAIPADRIAAVKNPQLLLSPEATAQVRDSFAALGAQGLDLFDQLMTVIRESLGSAITDLFAVGMGIMILGLVTCLFLREIPLRKSHHAPIDGVAPKPAAPEPPERPDRSGVVLGLALALVAREAQRPGADPHLLASLASTAGGRYPREWSDEERGRAVVRESIEPLAVALLASYVAGRNANGNGDGSSNGREATLTSLNGHQNGRSAS